MAPYLITIELHSGMTYRCVYCELIQETQFSYCILVMSLFESATYPKSRVSIVSKALWATAPAGSESAAIVLPFLARSARCVKRSTKRVCVCVLVGDVGDRG
jgi:hypothetical protein